MNEPGWYPDPDPDPDPDPEGKTAGRLRWWDGQQWTQDTQAAASFGSKTIITEPPEPSQRRQWKTWQLAAASAAALFLGVGIGGAAGGGDSSNETDIATGPARPEQEPTTSIRPTTTALPTTTEAPTTTILEFGERANPFPFGESVVFGRAGQDYWEIKVVDFQPDAGVQVAAETSSMTHLRPRTSSPW